MEELMSLVRKLETKSGQEAQVRVLQKIASMLLNEYEIRVGSLTIEPLLVEAYYYNKDKFPDAAVHAANDGKTTGKSVHARQR